MKPGRKPIDYKLALVRGTRRTDRHGTAETQPGAKPDGAPRPKAKWPAMPRKVFGEIGRREWRRIKKLMQDSGVITEADRTQLIQYTLLYEKLIENGGSLNASDHNALRLLCESLSLSPPGRGRMRNIGGD